MSRGADRAVERSPGLRIGSVAGVPVYLGRTWPIIVLVILVTFGPVVARARPDLGPLAYAVALAYAGLLLVSVLVHEAAHALVGIARGYRVARIVADLWGGHTAYDSTDTSPGDSALVAVAGPVANVLLAVVGSVLEPAVPVGVPHLLMVAFVWTNGFVAAFNLLPGLPLDGGFLVDALVWKLTGSRDKGMVAAGWCGRVVAAGVVLWFVGRPFLSGQRPSIYDVIWALVIGGFLWAGATQAIRGGKARLLLASIPVATVWQPASTIPVHGTVADLSRLVQTGRAGVLVVVVAPDGTALGTVDTQALSAIPFERQGGTPLTAVLRARPPGWVVDAGPQDDITDVVRVMQELGVREVPVRDPRGVIDKAVRVEDLGGS
ncbi:MAG TPA: site-2 protease family protein [Segeticoccus sp.]|uniref:M50 family metallopeptidase n=1 Tax=Segeticoccus sp. TaxID=2706531 RepID=UPI002D7E3215|nr:site-2 protease family protein [Segeticoccus sp.]HET8598741.1 site-2 protease family protein [Segeticoccus sp.]